VKPEDTNSQDSLRAFLHMQEQLHAMQLAIERNRQEADTASVRSAEALGNRLQALEQALAAQRSREFEVIQNYNQGQQSSNKVMVIVAGSFAAVGFVTMLLMALFQWRTINRLAELSAALPATHTFGQAAPVALLGAGDSNRSQPPAESPNTRLLGAIDRLEKRIIELEHTSQPGLPAGTPPDAELPSAPLASNGDHNSQTNGGPATAPATDGSTDPSRITLLLSKGQAMLDSNESVQAVACFNEVLAMDANHTEALVKKGTALEKLEKLEEAIECYDLAIAADNSMTIAYLYKGGLFNRMERFSEALECYEQALRTQERQATAKPL
jgi:tetratricopeptide (TPR) repeat protein